MPLVPARNRSPMWQGSASRSRLLQNTRWKHRRGRPGESRMAAWQAVATPSDFAARDGSAGYDARRGDRPNRLPARRSGQAHRGRRVADEDVKAVHGEILAAMTAGIRAITASRFNSIAVIDAKIRQQHIA